MPEIVALDDPYGGDDSPKSAELAGSLATPKEVPADVTEPKLQALLQAWLGKAAALCEPKQVPGHLLELPDTLAKCGATCLSDFSDMSETDLASVWPPLRHLQHEFLTQMKATLPRSMWQIVINFLAFKFLGSGAPMQTWSPWRL